LLDERKIDFEMDKTQPQTDHNNVDAGQPGCTSASDGRGEKSLGARTKGRRAAFSRAASKQARHAERQEAADNKAGSSAGVLCPLAAPLGATCAAGTTSAPVRRACPS